MNQLLLFASLSILILMVAINTTSAKYSRLAWVPLDQFKEEDQEEMGGSSYVGTSTNQKPSRNLAARIDLGEGFAIGHLHLEGKTFYYPLNGKQESFSYGGGAKNPKISVLTYGPGTVTWTYRKAGAATVSPPPNLVLAGFDANTLEPIYVCRGVTARGDLLVGSFQFSESAKGCLCSRLTYAAEFELLSVNLYAIASGAAAD